jgi:tetratricopeptide (TPR) repeat protein
MIQIDPNLLLLLIAAVFILMFGGRSILRREGLSAQFAVEAVGITGLLVGGTMLLGITLNPIVFLLLLYLITMRSRLLVDAGNLLAQRGKYTAAFRIYDAGLTWWPDMASLESVLAKDVRGNLGLRCEAATRYNLGLAYEQSGQAAKASEQYNETADLMPSSPFARAALAALERRKKKQPND